MSKLTEILKLFCYDPETDGANTFNIPKALNENWEKIDQLVLLAVAAAAAYDPEGSYAVGDYCTQGGKLHKCSTPILSGEPWNAEHWTETTVAVELSKKSNAFVGNAQSLGYTKIADITENGTYLIFDGPSFLSDYPEQLSKDGLNYGLLRVTDGESYKTYEIIAGNAPATKSGFAFGFLLKTEIAWERVADTTPPQEQNLMLSSGWNIKPGGYAMFFKTQENVVHVIMSICSNAAVSAGDVIATIPVGFRPAKWIQIPIICKVSGQSELKFGHLDFGYDGTFRIYDAVSGTEIVTEMAISPFSFLAAN